MEAIYPLTARQDIRHLTQRRTSLLLRNLTRACIMAMPQVTTAIQLLTILRSRLSLHHLLVMMIRRTSPTASIMAPIKAITTTN